MEHNEDVTSSHLKGIRAFRSSEGFEILVGKDAEANERLSLEIAEPHDFWLHAAGTEGSHVVVRNPERIAALPRRTLEEAAALAALFSKARGAPRAAVHHTTGRHVSKERRQPPGTVTLTRFREVKVAPEIPAGVEALP